SAHKLSRERRQSIVPAVGPAEFDRDVLTQDEAVFSESLLECFDITRVAGRVPGAQITNHRRRPLLRVRGKRPCSRCAAEKGDELASFHLRSQEFRGGSAVIHSTFAGYAYVNWITLRASRGKTAGKVPAAGQVNPAPYSPP